MNRGLVKVILLLLALLLTPGICFAQGAAPLPAPAWVNDGLGADEDVTSSITQLSANWAEVSGAAGYQYAIGTTPGGTNVVNWTNVGLTPTSVTKTGLALSHGTTYYFSVKGVFLQQQQQQVGPLTSSDGIRVDIGLTTLNVTPSPGTLVFYAGETSKNVSYILSLTGPSGVNINQERVNYEQDSRTLRTETPTISERISPGGRLELSRTIPLDDTLRNLILGGRSTATFNLVRTFSGQDDRANPVTGSVTIEVEVRTTPPERFEVTGLEVIMPTGPFSRDEEVRGRIRFSVSTGSGYVAGNIYIDGTGWRSFGVSDIGDGDETETPPLPTGEGTVGTHTLRVALTTPNVMETSTTYEVSEAVTIMERLTSLNVLKERDTPWSILEEITGTATQIDPPEGEPRDKTYYRLNGSGRLRINPLNNQVVDVGIENLVIEFNSTDPPNSRIVFGRGRIITSPVTPPAVLFRVYRDFLGVTKVEFQGGWDHLIIDCDLTLPVINQSLYSLTGITVRSNGIEGKSFDQEHEFTLCGLEFRLCRVSVSGREHPPIELGYASNEIYASLSGKISLRRSGRPAPEEITSFSGFRFGVNINTGEVSIAGNFALTDPFEFIPDNNYFNLTRLTFEFSESTYGIRADADINLPEPLNRFGAQTATFRFTSGGNIDGGINVIDEPSSERRSEPEPMTGGGSDPTQIPFWVCQLDLTYLGIDLAFSGGNLNNGGSRIKVGADLWVEAKDGWLRQELGTKEDPCFTIDFSGNPNWSLPTEISVLQNKKIDLGAVWLSINNLSIAPTPFAFIISAGFGIDVDVVQSSVGVDGLRVDLDGNVDWGTWREGEFTVLDVVSLEIGTVEYDSDGGDITLEVEGEGRTTSSETITVSEYFRITEAAINLRGGEIFSGSFEELLVYEKTDGQTKFAIKGVNIDIVGFTLLAGFEYRNPVIGVAGGISGYGLELLVVGKVGREEDGDLTFGLFAAADIPDVDIIPRLLVLSEIGGGFFYNPEQRDIDEIKSLCGVDHSQLAAKAGSRNIPSDFPEPGPGRFAVLVYGGFYCVEESLVIGQALITLTENYFDLSAHAEVLPDQGPLATGALYFRISWSPASAIGGVWVDVDIIDIVEGTGYFEFYIFSRSGEVVWAIMGGANLEVISIIDIEAEFFIGPPGFMVSGGLSVGIDLWIVSGGFSFEVMIWYERIAPDETWGAYAKGEVWGEVLGGLVGASAGLEGALIMPPPDVILGAYLRVEVLWVEVWSGSIWISIGASGIDGGTGRSSRLDQALEDARNMANQMNEEIAEVTEAIEEMQAAVGTLDPKTREVLGTMLVGLESYLLLPSFYWGEGDSFARTRPEVCNWIMDNILWDRRTYYDGEPKGLFQIRAGRNRLFDSFRETVTTISSLQERMMTKLEEALPAIGELPTVREQELGNPVRGMQYRTIEGRTLKVGYDLDQTKAEEQKGQMRQSKEEQQEYIRSVIQRTEELRELLAKTDELLYGRRIVEEVTAGGTIPLLRGAGLLLITQPTLMDLANRYTGCFDSLMNYYLEYFGYLDRAYSVSVAKQGELRAKETELRTALQTQANGLSLTDLKTLARNRRGMLMSLYNLAIARIREEGKDINDLPEEERPQEPAQLPSETAPLEEWRNICINFGMELWYHIPLAGYAKAASSISLLPVRKDLYERKSRFVNAWADFTTHLDLVYDRRVRLYELLYDLYDELSTTYGAYPLPVREDRVDIASLNIIEFKEIILERPSISGSSSSSSGTGGNPGPGIRSSSIGINPVGPGAGTGITPSGTLSTERFVRPGYSLSPGVTLPTFATYYGSKKGGIFTSLLPAEITSYSGECRGVDSRAGSYARLDCRFDATHPQEVVEYGLKMEQPDLLSEYEREFGTMSENWFSLGNQLKIFKFLFVPGDTSHGEGRTLYLRARGPAGNYIWRQGRFQVGYMPESRSSIDTIDRTPPVTPVVDDEGEWTRNSDRLYGSWETSDPESGIAEYQYRIIEGVATSSGIREIRQIVPWTSAGAMKELNIRGLVLDNNKTYYIKVKAINGAGRWSLVGTSDGIRTDHVAPRVTSLEFRQSEPGSSRGSSGGGLPSGSRVPGVTLTLTTGPLRYYPNSLYARFGAEDGESGIANYSFRLLDESGTELRSGTTTATLLNFQDLPLRHNQTYTLEIKAQDNVAWLSEPRTATVTIRFTDTTPPPAPTFRYLPPTPLPPSCVYTNPGLYIYSTSTVKIRWDEVNDPECGIYEYQVGIGTRREEPDILSWTSLGRATEYENTNLRLNNGTSYYLMVKAVNGAGLETKSVSRALVVETTPPTTPQLTYLGNLRMRFSSRDEESSVILYRYAIYNERGERRYLSPWRTIPSPGREVSCEFDIYTEELRAGHIPQPQPGWQIGVITRNAAGWQSEEAKLTIPEPLQIETPSLLPLPGRSVR